MTIFLNDSSWMNNILYHILTILKPKHIWDKVLKKMGQVNLWKIVFKKFEDRQFE